MLNDNEVEPATALSVFSRPPQCSYDEMTYSSSTSSHSKFFSNLLQSISIRIQLLCRQRTTPYPCCVRLHNADDFFNSGEIKTQASDCISDSSIRRCHKGVGAGHESSDFDVQFTITQVRYNLPIIKVQLDTPLGQSRLTYSLEAQAGSAYHECVCAFD